jgi:hypothetical protein
MLESMTGRLCPSETWNREKDSLEGLRSEGGRQVGCVAINFSGQLEAGSLWSSVWWGPHAGNGHEGGSLAR